MDLTEAKILGALCATHDTTPMTLSEIARLADVTARATAARIRGMAYRGLVRRKHPALLPTWWEITEIGWTVAHKPPNREYVKTREEVNK